MLRATIFITVLIWSSGWLGAQAPDAEKLKQIQRDKLAILAFVDGRWRGPSWRLDPAGQRIEMTQTERAGNMLDGCVKVVEGRGYDADGGTVFNAVAMIAYDPDEKKYVMRSHAEGRVGTFDVEVRDNGYVWEVPAGPATIRYTAEFAEDRWTEYGELISANRDPIRVFEMRLRKLGTTQWPAGQAVPFKPDERERSDD